MRILLTGPGGFLGSALAHFWAKRGHELLLLARPSSRLDRLADLSASVRVMRASRPDEVTAVVREAMPDAIVHTACSYGRKGESALDVMDANMSLGIALLQSVLDRDALGEPPTLFMNTGTVLEPGVSLYALSKTQFSAWGATLAASAPHRLQFIDIRLQQLYGPGDDGSKFIAHVIEACLRNEPRIELTAGYQRRDFIHIDDAVCAYDCIINQPASFAAASDAIDVGSGEAVTIRDFVELTKQLAGASTTLDFGAVPYRDCEPMLCVADINRIKGLGWRPKYSLTEGLASTLIKLKS
jgi:CDP-paratose synthetase